MGNNSALLTLYYLALGYLNPLIYYREHSVMISSTLDMSAWHSGCVRGAEPPPSLTAHRTHSTRNGCAHISTGKLSGSCVRRSIRAHIRERANAQTQTQMRAITNDHIDAQKYIWIPEARRQGRSTHAQSHARTHRLLASSARCATHTQTHEALSLVHNNHRKLVSVASNLPVQAVFHQTGMLYGAHE